MSLDTCENVDVMSPVCFVSSHTVPPAPLQKNKSQGEKEREKKCRGERWVKKILFRVIPSCCVFLSSGVLSPLACIQTRRRQRHERKSTFFFLFFPHTHTQHTHTHGVRRSKKKKMLNNLVVFIFFYSFARCHCC